MLNLFKVNNKETKMTDTVVSTIDFDHIHHVQAVFFC